MASSSQGDKVDLAESPSFTEQAMTTTDASSPAETPSFSNPLESICQASSNSREKMTSGDCHFCTSPDSCIGVQKLIPVSDKDLQKILKQGFGKKLNIGHKLMQHCNRLLKEMFNLGDGSKDENKRNTFNSLSLI